MHGTTRHDAILADYELGQRIYARFAAWYDWVVLPIRPLRRRVAALARVGPGQTVLDVATGTGEQAMAFAAASATVTGLDIAPAMLARARRKNRRACLSYVEADASALPFEDDRFDVASVSFALHEMPANLATRVLREMGRVVRRAGRIVVVDYGLPQGRLGRLLVYHLVALYERAPYRAFVRRDLSTAIRDAGFEVVVDEPALGGTVRILVGIRA